MKELEVYNLELAEIKKHEKYLRKCLENRFKGKFFKITKTPYDINRKYGKNRFCFIEKFSVTNGQVMMNVKLLNKKTHEYDISTGYFYGLDKINLEEIE